ncbi:MAG: YigZ family protein [Treponema sp.]|nr:IMPACT family protein [Treponema sp.]MDY4984645.1 YigZ family protein [Treponema sp.]
MLVLTKPVQFEEIIKGSRFLSELIPCESQAQARDILKAQKEKYADATHVVHAFIVGKNGEVMGMSDDGEPSGTAGRPTLDVLKGRNCTNLIITITRWFGGTLLGTGGLVKAYSNGAKQVLEAAATQNAFEELIEKTDFIFSTDYSLYKLLKNNFVNYQLYNISEDFGTEVTISGQIKADQYNDFASHLLNLSNGKIKL